MEQDNVKFRYKACNPPNCGCPDVEYDNGLVTINDDFGGKVKLTMQELSFIAEKTRNLVELAKEDIVKQHTANQQDITEKKKAKGV